MYEVQVSTNPAFSPLSASSGIVNTTQSPAWNAPSLPDGTYYWRVRVSDPFGVWSSWSTATRFGLDTVAPVAAARRAGSIVSPGVSTMPAGEPLALEATDAGSGVARIEYSRDGGAWTTYSSPVTFDDTGRHLLA